MFTLRPHSSTSPKCVFDSFSGRRRGLAGAERCSRESQGGPNPHYVRARAAEDASCGPLRVLERRHSLAEIVERGVVGPCERNRETPPHREQEIITRI